MFSCLTNRGDVPLTGKLPTSEVRSCIGIWYDQNDSRYDPLLFWFHKHLVPA